MKQGSYFPILIPFYDKELCFTVFVNYAKGWQISFFYYPFFIQFSQYTIFSFLSFIHFDRGINCFCVFISHIIVVFSLIIQFQFTCTCCANPFTSAPLSTLKYFFRCLKSYFCKETLNYLAFGSYLIIQFVTFFPLKN